MNFKLVVFLLIILAFRFFFFYQNQPQYQDGQDVNFTTTLNSEPQIVGNQQRFVANLASGNRIYITTSKDPAFHYGDSLVVSGRVNNKLLKNKNTILTMSSPKIESVKSNKDTFLAITSVVRQRLINFYSTSLEPTYSSLMLGIVFGIKESLPGVLSNNLKNAGVYHVVAASGMNVSIVAVFLLSLFSFFLGRKLSLIATIIGIIFYASLAGFAASIVRAGIMGGVALTAQFFGRQSMAIFSLVLAGFIMLFLSPNLISDIGFQLSFLATLGLLYIKLPSFGKSAIFGDIGITISAQLATFPILMANFGTYPILSIVSNALLLWTIPILMILGGVAAIISFVFMPLAQLLIYLAVPFIVYFEKVAEFISNSGPIFKIETFPWQLGVGYYLVLFSILLAKSPKKQ